MSTFSLKYLLVHHIDLLWNTLEPSLVLMYQKLIQIPDFVERVGKVQ
jgi:hypothetical protein